MLSLLKVRLLVLLVVLLPFLASSNDDGGPKVEALTQSKVVPATPQLSGTGDLPIFPERNDAAYFVVAVSGGVKTWGRTLARTLLDMGDDFMSPYGPPLRPIYVDLPVNGRFSAKVLTTLCEQIEGIPISGIIVVGDGQAARSIALSGNAMKVPVLWAKGGTAQLQESSESQNSFQATLQPSAKEILEAIRAIFLQTHWHSFFVLSDIRSTMVLGGTLGNILKKSPLSPTILPLSSSKDNNDEVFRQLAKISRSTRGIVLLLCDLNVARRIMSEATRLKMTGGHFIWIWADTSSTAEFFQPFDVAKATFDEEDYRQQPKVDSKYYQGQPSQQQQQQFSGGGRRQNQTRNKSINSSRYHHIIGLRKSNGANDDQIAVSREKRKKSPFDDSHESDRANIKNINSNEFNANYYDPHVRSPSSEGNIFNAPSDFDDTSDYDYGEKSNPYLSPSSSSSSSSSRGNNVGDNLDLDNYSETSNDSKAKRADNFAQSTFNISSHVFFHNFKDFPVGLLALRHIKMNVDRVFVRSAIRLFASTWARVEKNEEIRLFISGGSGKAATSSSKRDYDDYGGVYGSDLTTSNRGRVRSNNKVNNRYSNKRKFKRDTQETIVTTTTTASSIQTHVNTSINSRNHSESGLRSSNQSSGTAETIKSNISNKVNISQAAVNSKNNNNKNKRSWWTPSGNQQQQTSQQQRARAQDKARILGTPQYKGGCFGMPNRSDIRRSEIFARYLREAVALALSGKTLPGVHVEKPLISNFEILNLVPTHNKVEEQYPGSNNNNNRDDVNRKSPTMTPTTKSETSEGTKWRRVGLVLGRKVHLDTIVWPGGDIVVSGLSARARSVFRVVTSLSPPFVMESNLDEDGLCLRGLPCHRLSTSGKHNLTLMFNSIETNERFVEDAVEHGNQIPLNEDHKSNDKLPYKTRCCYGLSMDLLDNIASELGFGYILYIVSDELFGSKQMVRKSVNGSHTRDVNRSTVIAPSTHDTFEEHLRERSGSDKGERNARRFDKKYQEQSQWNGIIGDLVAGSADMSFAPLSVSKTRAEVVDFSAPYFHSGISLLAAPKVKTDIPLLAFLMPFSPELWIAVFIWLNLTAIAVAIYEWLSPFGLNPWGRQRSKNFSLSSALWVMWGLLFGHLVAFKAPKSWPNKFLINVWGGFSVIFIASYTANIAALIAGLFFHNAANTYDTSLLTQRVGIPRASAAESYIQRYDKHLWERMKKYTFNSIEDGIQGLKNGTIDLLMADTPILDYYRGSDHGCNLRRIGENYIEDTYAIGMSKGFPLKESISALIAKYSSNGYLDILLEKWYGGLPCYRDENEIEIVQPRPLGVAAVAGVFLLLGLGMILGVFILIFEHMFFKYYLPILRHSPKGSMWRSRNLMFFSQKLYRFINCVELVSPHHAARELVHTLRKGHITSLFQKSVKRKEDEQRRRRKSKAQFFEMIQEIRRVQQGEKEQQNVPKLEVVEEVDGPQTLPLPSPNPDIQSIASSATSTSTKPRASPKIKFFGVKRDGHSRSNSSTLNIRRFSTDSIIGERLDTIGRRLSRDIVNDLANSPPDIGHRFETFGKGATANSAQKFDTFSGKMGITKSADDLDKSSSKFDTFSGKIDDDKPELPAKRSAKGRQQQKRKPLTCDTYTEVTFGNQATIKESFRETLHPAIFQLDKSKAILRDKLHEELREKYGVDKKPSKKPPKVPSTSNRPPLRGVSSNPNDSFLKVQSSDSLNFRPTPTPRGGNKRFTDDDDDDEGQDPTYATILPRNKASSPRVQTTAAASNSSNLQLGRLSKEDLLNLTQRTESEIKEFLNGNVNTKHKTRRDPPP